MNLIRLFRNLFRTLQLALKSLALHKLRSGLTMLGIVFGVFSVIAMLAIGEGASKQAQDQVLKLGATNIICVSVKPPQDTSQSTGSSRRSFGLRYGLLRSDYDLLANTIPTVIQAIPIREMPKEARHQDHALNTRLVGCTSPYLEVNHLTLAAGRFITDRDNDSNANVAVIADEVVESLFPIEDPIDSSIRVDGKYFRIVGVTRARTASAAIGGSLSGQDFNKDVYIPIKTLRVRFGDQVARRTSGSFSIETVQLNQITLQVRDRKDVISTAEVVRESLDRAHKAKKDVSVVVPLELLKQADQIRRIFNIVLGSIAAISLVVGGIGIMNIMLANVTERTREIGIRRALGAKRRDIIHQFLMETIVLSGTGGLVGLVFGICTPLVFEGIKRFVMKFVMTADTARSELGRMFVQMEPKLALWSLPVAFGISVLIGIASGLYPAILAARLDPIEALRHE